MRAEEQRLEQFLLDLNLATKDKMLACWEMARKQNKSLEQVLVENKVITEVELGKVRAYIMGIPYVDLSNMEVDLKILKIIPEQVARKYMAVPFDKKGNQLKIAMLDPSDLQCIDFISKKTNLEIVPCLADEEAIKKVLRLFQKNLQAEFGDLVGAMDGMDDERLVIRQDNEEGKDDEGVDLRKAAEDLPVVKIVDVFLKHAIFQGVSDIHIEPEERSVIIRFRIDGILHDAMTLPKIIMPGIIARIKVLANLKIDEHRLPQDGRFKVESADYKVAFRVSIMPVFDGEKIVMRLLNEAQEVLSLEKMGFRERDLTILNAEITKPNGMILVVGPTGSGKTTTLYTVLGLLNQPDVNINTLEDPVEYRMPRVNQSQVNTKINFTFASGLRALLRQDPDVIMVGEIRDGETAELAVHAALTGHLVLSTLHTNSAAGTLPRIFDMGIESFMVASTVNVIISQRLVRKVCKECAESYHMDDSFYTSFAERFDLERLGDVLRQNDLVKKDYKNVKDLWMDLKFTRGVGCTKCRQGYKGRMGVYEVLQVTDGVKKLINAHRNADEIEQQAVKEGMSTMLEDGIVKAVMGLTTIEEVIRVTKE